MPASARRRLRCRSRQLDAKAGNRPNAAVKGRGSPGRRRAVRVGPMLLDSILDNLGERLAAPPVPKRGKGRREWYRGVYLRSEHWASVRVYVIARRGGICQRCREKRGSTVH